MPSRSRQTRYSVPSRVVVSARVAGSTVTVALVFGLGRVDRPRVVEHEQRAADDDRRGQGADQDRQLLRPRRAADEEAGLEVLRGRPAVGGGDADDRRDRQRRELVLGPDPAHGGRRPGTSAAAWRPSSPRSGSTTSRSRPSAATRRSRTGTRRARPAPPRRPGRRCRSGSGRRGDRRHQADRPEPDDEHRQVALGPSVAAPVDAGLGRPRAPGRGSAAPIEARIIGRTWKTLMIPPVATAPAPM